MGEWGCCRDGGSCCKACADALRARAEAAEREVAEARSDLEMLRAGLRLSGEASDRLREMATRAAKERNEARADAARLREALRDAAAYLWPSPDEGHTGFVDRLGMQFYRETGIWPHFKSQPMEVARELDTAEAQRRWSAWLEAKRNAAAETIARALSPSPESDRSESGEGTTT